MSSPTTQPLQPSGAAAADVTRFVAAVRAELDDLSPDEVTELTGGLEADLTDALGESGGAPSPIGSSYGDPAAYAAELRTAAGLPPRGAEGASRGRDGGRVRPDPLAGFRRSRDDVRARLEGQTWWPAVRDFLLVLRPTWWVLRAWVAVQLLMLLFEGSGWGGLVPGGLGGLVLLVIAVVVSVQLGRRAPLRSAALDLGVRVGNVVAVLALMVVAFDTSVPRWNEGGVEVSGPYRTSGLWSGDQPVTNVFPYDAEGRPLTGVQLYDQDGRPIEIGEAERFGYDEVLQRPYQAVPGSPPGSAPRWNAFPLQRQLVDEMNNVPGPVQPAPLPLSGVPTPSTTGSTGPTSPTGSVAPTTSPTPSQSPSGTPSRTPSESPSPTGSD